MIMRVSMVLASVFYLIKAPSVGLKKLTAMSPWPHTKGRNFTRDFMSERFQNTEMSIRSNESQRIILHPVILN